MNERFNLYSVLTLWYKPRDTMQELIKNDRGHFISVLLAVSFGIVQASRFYLADADVGKECFLYGSLLGWSGLYFFAWLLRNFGRWFGGHARQKEVRIALGWGICPWLLLFIILVLALGLVEDSTLLANYFWIFFLGFIYGYCILINTLSAALSISTLKTLLCLGVTSLVSIFPLSLLIQVLASIA